MSDGLLAMKCRLCGATIVPSSTETGIKADSYEACFYKCPNASCNVAYSNSKNERKRTLIYPSADLNVPPEVRVGLVNHLRRTLNVTNRGNKNNKFAYDTSEDAVTWTVFRYMQIESLLGTVFKLQLPKLLLWGAEFGANGPTALETAVLSVLIDELAETPESLSEPDVILCGESHIYVIEVKYNESTNTAQPNYEHFDRYLDAVPGLFNDVQKVRSDGYYELARNLVIAELLGRKLKLPWTVCNLAFKSCKASADEFAASLMNPTQFSFIAWPDFCCSLPDPTQPWFKSFLQQKGLE